MGRREDEMGSINVYESSAAPNWKGFSTFSGWRRLKEWNREVLQRTRNLVHESFLNIFNLNFKN